MAAAFSLWHQLNAINSVRGCVHVIMTQDILPGGVPAHYPPLIFSNPATNQPYYTYQQAMNGFVAAIRRHQTFSVGANVLFTGNLTPKLAQFSRVFDIAPGFDENAPAFGMLFNRLGWNQVSHEITTALTPVLVDEIEKVLEYVLPEHRAYTWFSKWDGTKETRWAPWTGLWRSNHWDGNLDSCPNPVLANNWWAYTVKEAMDGWKANANYWHLNANHLENMVNGARDDFAAVCKVNEDLRDDIEYCPEEVRRLKLEVRMLEDTLNKVRRKVEIIEEW